MNKCPNDPFTHKGQKTWLLQPKVSRKTPFHSLFRYPSYCCKVDRPSVSYDAGTKRLIWTLNVFIVCSISEKSTKHLTGDYFTKMKSP